MATQLGRNVVRLICGKNTTKASASVRRDRSFSSLPFFRNIPEGYPYGDNPYGEALTGGGLILWAFYLSGVTDRKTDYESFVAKGQRNILEYEKADLEMIQREIDAVKELHERSQKKHNVPLKT